MTLLEQALTRLREENVSAGKPEQFERLRAFVAGENEVTCGELAVEMV